MLDCYSYLASMCNIPSLEERLNAWQPLVDQASLEHENHPVMYAYNANVVLNIIQEPDVLKFYLGNKHFNVDLFLKLFEVEHKRLNICPDQASKYIDVLSKLGYFQLDIANSIKTGLGQLAKKQLKSIGSISIFDGAEKAQDKQTNFPEFPSDGKLAQSKSI